jgi:hypothetical protein
MSGKMGSGAEHILEGIKRKSPKEGAVKESQIEVKSTEPHNVEVPQLLSDELINVNVLHEAVELALNKKQRISVWAPDIALVMWYLKLSKPMFSISEVAKKYIAQGLERDYPELCKRSKEELEKNR